MNCFTDELNSSPFINCYFSLNSVKKTRLSVQKRGWVLICGLISGFGVSKIVSVCQSSFLVIFMAIEFKISFFLEFGMFVKREQI